MQGQRGKVGSFPESFNFDHGSSSSSTVMDTQIFRNNTRNQTEIGLQDYTLPVDTNVTHMNHVGLDLDRHNLNHGWAIGEPSSSAGTGLGLRLEEPCFPPTSALSLDNTNRNPIFKQSANSGTNPQGLNLNETIMGQGGDDDCQIMGFRNLFKPNGPESEQLPPASGPDPFFLHPAHGGFLVEDNDSRAGSSMEGRRGSCKRKAVEGQSSASGSRSGSVWPPVQGNMGSGLSISAPSEPLNPRLGLGVRRVSPQSQPNAEGSQRNFRVRINPPIQQNPVSFSSSSTSNVVRRPSRSSSSHQSRVLPVNNSLDFNTNPQNQSASVQVPILPHNVNDQPFRWNGSSSSRTANSSNPSMEALPRNIQILEHPMFTQAPEMRSLARNPSNVNLTGQNSNVTVQPSSAPSWVPDQNLPRFPRRLSEYVRRSLFPSAGQEPGGQSSTHSPVHAGLQASSPNVVHPSGPGTSGLHQTYPRLASWAERQGDGVLGFSHPLRNLPAGSEGRRRLASEIRNVLDLMRRGEGLRLEDVMIIDPSVLFGVADIHDRHRDMRLDVDNMSYEELLALEERIGNVCTGLSEGTILSRLKQRKYSQAVIETEAAAEPCCVCQEEYNNGDDIGTLECGHDFHKDCIKQWLMQKNICPICKTTGLST